MEKNVLHGIKNGSRCTSAAPILHNCCLARKTRGEKGGTDSLMDMTNKEYGKYVEKKAAPSPTPKNLAWAFVTGGLICTLGQGLLNLYRSMGLSETSASIAVPVTLIFLAVLFTGLGWFDKLAKHAGAGTLVPITGFANAMASPALEFRSDD